MPMQGILYIITNDQVRDYELIHICMNFMVQLCDGSWVLNNKKGNQKRTQGQVRERYIAEGVWPRGSSALIKVVR